MANVKKSSLKDRMKASGVREDTRFKDVEHPGGGSLPAGINGGVARLTRLDFDEISTGELAKDGNQRMYFHGVCVEPKELVTETGVVRTEGLLVQSKAIPLCDSKDWQGKEISFEENFAKAENKLKLIGIPTEEFEDTDFEEAVLAYKDENEIYFRFRTYSMGEEPDVRTITTIEGGIPDYAPIDDETDGVEVEDETPTPKAAPKSTSKATPKATPKSQPAAEEETDWVAVGLEADKGDEPSAIKVSDWAMAHDIDPEDESFADWSEVVAGVLASLGTTEEEEEEEGEEPPEAEEFVPEKGSVYGYKPPRARSIKECEVTAVFEGRKTCNLKSLDDGKSYKAVPWDALSEL